MKGLASVFDALLLLIAATMFLRGKYGITREMSLAPLTLAVLDAAFSAPIDPWLTPFLSVMLLALQAAVLSFCGLLLYQDKVQARNRAGRRKRRREWQRNRALFERAQEAAQRQTSERRRTPRICA